MKQRYLADGRVYLQLSFGDSYTPIHGISGIKIEYQQLVYRQPGFLSKSGGTHCKIVTVLLLLVLSSLTKGHSLGINIHQTSMNKMTPQQQVLDVPKIQLQEYEGQIVYTGPHLMMMMMVVI
jgi:hypothetical protein